MVSEYLKKGEENAISRAELLRITGLGERALYSQIAAERKRGTLICSKRDSAGGYYLAENREEICKTLNILESQAKSSFLVCRSFRKALNNLPGQVMFGNEEGNTIE